MKRRRRWQLAAAKKAPAAAAATDGDVPVAAPASSVDWCRSRSENHGKKPDDIPLLTQHSSRSVLFLGEEIFGKKDIKLSLPFTDYESVATVSSAHLSRRVAKPDRKA